MFTFQFLNDKIYSYSNKGYLTLGNLAKLLITHILFELQPIIVFSLVANFGDQSLFSNLLNCVYFKSLCSETNQL